MLKDNNEICIENDYKTKRFKNYFSLEDENEVKLAFETISIHIK